MRQGHRTGGSWWRASALLLGLLLSAAAPAAGTTAGERSDAGTVRIVISYRDATGSRVRLAGVEVLLLEVLPSRHMGPIWDPGGNERYACTNANGVATFRNVPADTELWAVTGAGHPGTCSNAEYLNPSTGEKMLSVDWQNLAGSRQHYEPFYVQPNEVRTIRILARTPADQDRVCGGFYATWVGNPGIDVYNGTAGPDVIVAGEGNDRISGGDGWDIICGGPGRDVVSGGDDGDIIFGDDGRDTLDGQWGVDWLFGGLGIDTCRNGESLAGCESTG